MFNRKSVKCQSCNTKIKEVFSYCPYCGEIINKSNNEINDYGLLGKNDNINNQLEDNNVSQGFTITDKLIGSLMNSLIKNLDKQFRNLQKGQPNMPGAEIKNLPNGIKIRIGPVMQQNKKSERKVHRNQITKEQIEKMSLLPRTEAKTKITRLNNKIIYELSASGVQSPDDVFISKLESGYEIKAIGNKKVYVNALPVNLPLKGFSIHPKKLEIEFISQTNF